MSERVTVNSQVELLLVTLFVVAKRADFCIDTA